MHFLLIFDVVDDYANRRQPLRSEHLALATEFHHRGLLELGGALDDPLDMAILLFQCDCQTPIEEFVARDPYVQNEFAVGIPSWEKPPKNLCRHRPNEPTVQANSDLDAPKTSWLIH